MHATFGFIRELDLDAWSLRSSRDETGVAHPASITFSLFGRPEPDAPRVTLSMTLDEAEELSGTLAQLVADARQAEYSEPGHGLPEFPGREDVRRAWSDLVAEDIEDDEAGADELLSGAENDDDAVTVDADVNPCDGRRGDVVICLLPVWSAR